MHRLKDGSRDLGLPRFAVRPDPP